MKNKVTIGIADDHSLMLDTLKSLLTKNDYDVTIEACNGYDLITQIENALKKPGICFVDGRMPNMDGVETVKATKAKWPEIKVISYSNDIHKGLEMIQNGADVYLTKNSSEESIIKCITELLFDIEP